MADPIQDFLVRLRFVVDESQQRHFDDMIKRSGESLKALDLDLLAAVTTIGETIEKVSERLRDFYIMSAATGTPVSSLEQMRAGYAAIGMSAAEAQKSVVDLYNTFHSQPGLEQYLAQQMGYRGDLNNLPQFRNSLLNFLKTDPRFQGPQGKQTAELYMQSLMGWSPYQTSQWMALAEREQQGEARQRASLNQLGLNPQKMQELGKASTDLQRDFAYLETALGNFGLVLTSQWIGKVDDAIKMLTRWVEAINKFAADGGPAVSLVIGLAAAIGGFTASLGALRTALRLVGIGRTAAGAAGIAGAGGAAGGGALGALGPIGLGLTTGLATGFGAWTLLESQGQFRDADWASLRADLAKRGYKQDFIEQIISTYQKAHPEGTAKELGAQLPMTPPPGGGAAATPTPGADKLGAATDPLGALMQQLENSAATGKGSISPKGAIGRNQIMPDTARRLGFDPAKLSDPAYNNMVARALQAWEAKTYHGDLEAMAVDYNAGATKEHIWERSGRNLAVLPAETQRYIAHLRRIQETQPGLYAQAQAEARAGGAAQAPAEGATVNQTNNFNIYGSGDPRQAGQATAQQLDRVNADLTRHMNQKAY